MENLAGIYGSVNLSECTTEILKQNAFTVMKNHQLLQYHQFTYTHIDLASAGKMILNNVHEIYFIYGLIIIKKKFNCTIPLE